MKASEKLDIWKKTPNPRHIIQYFQATEKIREETLAISFFFFFFQYFIDDDAVCALMTFFIPENSKC